MSFSGASFRAMREVVSMTPKEAAKAIDMNLGLLKDIEAGKTEPTLREAMDLANLYFRLGVRP